MTQKKRMRTTSSGSKIQNPIGEPDLLTEKKFSAQLVHMEDCPQVCRRGGQRDVDGVGEDVGGGRRPAKGVVARTTGGRVVVVGGGGTVVGNLAYGHGGVGMINVILVELVK